MPCTSTRSRVSSRVTALSNGMGKCQVLLLSGGANRQVELLKAEGVGFLDESHVDMEEYCVRAIPLISEE